MKALALDYRGILLHADRAAWFNATEIAEAHGKQLQKFWQREETHEYIAALCEHLNHPKTDDLNRPFNPKDYPQFIKTRRGRNGGTWLHPDLMVHFARWISPRFSVWCDQTIKRLLTEQPAWRQQRRELGSITRLKNRLLQEQRAALGKDTQPYHYSNEALMENEALTGRREPIDRDRLTLEELTMLDTILAENAVMIAQGIPTATRKARLFAIAAPIREAA